MQLVSNATTPTTPAAPGDAGAKQPVAGSGVQGVVGDVLRSTAAGYQAVSNQQGVVADKAAIHPFESVVTATSLLRDATANYNGISKVTNVLNTVAGMAMLVISSTVSGMLRAPGDTAADIANHVADAIDGRKTANGWNLGWGVRTPSEDSAPPAEQVS